jgi:serine protease Do
MTTKRILLLAAAALACLITLPLLAGTAESPAAVHADVVTTVNDPLAACADEAAGLAGEVAARALADELRAQARAVAGKAHDTKVLADQLRAEVALAQARAADGGQTVDERTASARTLAEEMYQEALAAADNQRVERIVTMGDAGYPAAMQSYLGIGVAEIDSDRAKELKLAEVRGVEVKSVEDDSPAAKAGLKEGDVVLEYNGARVEGTAQFVRMVRETPADRQVKLSIWRGGSTQTVAATTSARKARLYDFDLPGHGKILMKRHAPGAAPEAMEPPEPPEPPEPGEAPEAPSVNEEYDIQIPEINIPDIHIPEIQRFMVSVGAPKLGVETETLGSQLAEFFGVKEGVLVRSVVKGSAAEKAGMKAGDVITKMDGKSVARPGDIVSTLHDISSDRSIPITIVRNGKEMTVTARIDAPKKSDLKTPGARHIRVITRDLPGEGV